MHVKIVTFLLISLSFIVDGYYVTLSGNGPAIIGSNITLTALLFDDNGVKPSGSTFMFKWHDNANPQHLYKNSGEIASSVWTLSYPADAYHPGDYIATIEVFKVYAFNIQWLVASHSLPVKITSFLNGELEVIQNGTVLGSKFVADNSEVTFRIEISENDLNFIHHRNATINSYWFIDCMYMGMMSDVGFAFNFTTYTDKDTSVKAFMIVSYEDEEPSNLTYIGNDIGYDVVKPEICENSSFVPTDPNKTYGFFSRDLSVRSPIHSVELLGPNWLKQGQMLNMSVTCKGSPLYWHCVRTVIGNYNVTGDENCTKMNATQQCFIGLSHYFADPRTYTLLFIIRNSVSKVVKPFSLTIFKEPKHAQLSVIIVPVSCSAIAVILIVFGVAYYIQKRNRYMVEVADFDFSQANDTEYKTFRERLRDAVTSAFTPVGEELMDDGSGSNVWSPSRKYGSMQ